MPEWTKLVKWSPEDGCYIGYIEGPLGPCCHGDDPEVVREELAEIEREWRALLGMPRGASCEYRPQQFSGFKRKRNQRNESQIWISTNPQDPSYTSR